MPLTILEHHRTLRGRDLRAARKQAGCTQEEVRRVLRWGRQQIVWFETERLVMVPEQAALYLEALAALTTLEQLGSLP